MFSEPFDVYFAEFSVFATVGGQQVRVIFDRANSTMAGDALGMASSSPAITLKTSDVPANPVGTLVVLDGANWRVAEHQPDGTGVSVLVLERAA